MAKLGFEIIAENAPFLKQIIEQKIAEEVDKKQVEIDDLKQENLSLRSEIDVLALEILNMMGV